MRAATAQGLALAFVALVIVAPPARGQATPDGPPTEVTPQGAPPASQPPPPPATVPAPPLASSESPAPSASDTGQWVYTSQYGWVWMAYGDQYVYTPADETSDPYEYVYYPAQGWVWLVAPWVWGVGPLPWFGSVGPWHYHWYRGPAYHPRSAARPLFRGGVRHSSGTAHGGGRH